MHWVCGSHHGAGSARIRTPAACSAPVWVSPRPAQDYPPHICSCGAGTGSLFHQRGWCEALHGGSRGKLCLLALLSMGKGMRTCAVYHIGVGGEKEAPETPLLFSGCPSAAFMCSPPKRNILCGQRWAQPLLPSWMLFSRVRLRGAAPLW